MTLECCCRRPHEFQFCRQPIPHTGFSDRERAVSESPLRPWKKEVAVAGGAQRRACWYVGDRCEQVGYIVWCVADECLMNEQTQLVLDPLCNG